MNDALGAGFDSCREGISVAEERGEEECKVMHHNMTNLMIFGATGFGSCRVGISVAEEGGVHYLVCRCG